MIFLNLFFAFLGFAILASMLSSNPSSLWTKPEAKSSKPVRIEHQAPESPEEVVDLIEQSELSSSLAPESLGMNMQSLNSLGSAGSDSAGPFVGGGELNARFAKSTEGYSSAAVLKRTALEYPPEARRKGISGVVDLRILVGPSGRVESVQVKNSSPAGTFEQAAVRSVKEWKFRPALREGKVTATWMEQRIRFELN